MLDKQAAARISFKKRKELDATLDSTQDSTCRESFQPLVKSYRNSNKYTVCTAC